MISGDLLSAFPHRQFYTLPGLLDSWAALPNSNPNACMPMQGGSLYHFYDGLWYDPAERRTHDLPCERRTRYRLSQPDTVSNTVPVDQVLYISFCHIISVDQCFNTGIPFNEVDTIQLRNINSQIKVPSGNVAVTLQFLMNNITFFSNLRIVKKCTLLIIPI